MRYISTNANSPSVDVRKALSGSFAADGGLYMPQTLPRLPRAFFNNIGEMSMAEIAFVVASAFFAEDLDSGVIKKIVDSSFSFEAPLHPLGNGSYMLELFHGPTLTFKDYGARFVARVAGALDASRHSGHRTVLVATTGNSGAATANGLYGLPDVDVVVLYPQGVLSRMQMAQFATLGGNVHAVEVEGTIEDCKKLIRSAMADHSLEYLRLATMNSINVGRLIPQIVFSLHAYSRLVSCGLADAADAVYAIPCGNFSNLIATLMAVEMGLPCRGVAGVCNANDALGHIMRGQSMPERPMATIAPSLDTVRPSGACRLRYLTGISSACASKLMVPPCIEDREIASALLRLKTEYAYTADPHTAAAFAAAHTLDAPGPKVVFATGHPAKSLDTMTRITGGTVELPVQLNRFMGRRRMAHRIPPTAAALRRLLITIA